MKTFLSKQMISLVLGIFLFSGQSFAADSKACDLALAQDPARLFFAELAQDSNISAADLYDQVILKVRSKIHNKKAILPWIEIVQAITSIKKTFAPKIVKYKAAQIAPIRLSILKRALSIPEIRNDFLSPIYKSVMAEFKASLRRPDLRSILKKSAISDKDFVHLLATGDVTASNAFQVLESEIFKEAVDLHSTEMAAIQRSIIIAYRTRASKFRRTLTVEQLFEGLAEKIPTLRQQKFSPADLSLILGESGESLNFPFEFKLFSSIRDVYNQTIDAYPNQFERVLDVSLFDEAHHLKIIEKFKAHKRMIVTWAAPRVEVDKDFFAAMVRYAQEQDAFIVVVPEAGQPMELDPILFNHPLVHICVHTIEFTPWLKLNALPLPGKRVDPLSNLRAPNRGGNRGVVNIVGHPQMRDEILPTADNDLFKHRLISTGALTKPWYNSKFVIGHVTDQQARDVHMNGFLVVEKDKANSGFDGEGVANTLHTRHVEFIAETKSIIDMGRQYTPTHTREIRPEAMVAGDDHVGHEHLEFAREKLKIIRKYRPKMYVAHDIFDGTSINHWEAQDPLKMAKKAKAGQLNLTKELTQVVHFINAVQASDPEILVAIDDANHNAWLIRLLKEMDKLGQPENDPVVAELWNAWHNHGIEPLQYFLVERAIKISRDPDLKNRQQFWPAVADPSRLQFIAAGQSLKIGPEHRQIEIGEHGHHSGGMTKAALSLRMSAGRGFGGIVYGHTHSSGRNFRSVNAGASVGKGDYALGGPSAVDMGFVFVYRDGTIQLHHFDDKSLTYALEEAPVAPARNYQYVSYESGLSYPRLVILEDQKMNLDTLDQFRKVHREERASQSKKSQK